MPGTPLYGLSVEELEKVCLGYGLPRFTASQIADWMYSKHVRGFDQMTNLSKKARSIFEQNHTLGLYEPSRVDVSSDGTRKYLYGTSTGEYIESVYIPDRDRATLCVSSQAGCRMGCRFCATGRMGLKASLSTTEILNQIESLPERDTLTNIVFMGMGEPLDNVDAVLQALDVLTSAWGWAWSPTRITVSTAGVDREIDRFMRSTQVHLAISLHNPFGEEREKIMPIEKAYHITDLVRHLHEFDFSHQRRLSFEYIVLSGLNDSPRHAAGLVKLLAGLQCRINLIRFHRIPGSDFFSPSDREVEAFRDTLSSHGITTTIRASRGEDIRAACGLLSTEKRKEPHLE